MIDLGKKNVIGVMIDAVDYEGALFRIMSAARDHRSYAVSALAVHGVMTGVQNDEHKFRINSLDLVVPDGQPVRWALNSVHRTGLFDRVYGPELTLRALESAEREHLPVYLYGTTPDILDRLHSRLRKLYPALIVAGTEPSKFRTLNAEERSALADRIKRSGAAIVLVGLGCPRQEVFVYEMKDLLPMPMLAVGAAFAFIAGELAQAPNSMQRWGLEWLFRLGKEPRRLWRRYLLLNPQYLCLLAGQAIGIRFSSAGVMPLSEVMYG